MAITVKDPASLGIDPVKLDELRDRVRREVDAGLLPACQFALARDGQVVAFETFGDADLDTRFTIYSATKAIVASAAWILIASGDLDVSRTSSTTSPSSGRTTKTSSRWSRSCCTRPASRTRPSGHRPGTSTPRGSRRSPRWRLNWEPGTRYEYHATSAHWVLAELIERVAGVDYRDFVEQRVTAAARPASRRGHPARGAGRRRASSSSGANRRHPTSSRRCSGSASSGDGGDRRRACSCTNRADVRAVGVPGAGGIASAATVALFYQGLLHDDAGIWDARLLADVTGRVRNTFRDPLLQVPANRTLGLIVAGDDGNTNRRGFGHTQSPRTFGHDGAGGQIAWADPESGLSFCYLTNGRDLHPIREARRTVGISSRAPPA